MTSNNELQEQARNYALKAVEYDKKGLHESAIFFYMEASQALINSKQINGIDNPLINSYLNDYISRAEKLKKILIESKSEESSEIPNTHVKSELEVMFDDLL
jgi:PDZ domain-containing secreted protein